MAKISAAVLAARKSANGTYPILYPHCGKERKSVHQGAVQNFRFMPMVQRKGGRPLGCLFDKQKNFI